MHQNNLKFIPFIAMYNTHLKMLVCKWQQHICRYTDQLRLTNFSYLHGNKFDRVVPEMFYGQIQNSEGEWTQEWELMKQLKTM